ncbi:MAG: LacI family DNA-binding transcriptional regulator [Lentisphaerae bacterium]|nr:LacI family DNA-binding transcriptional regulator [Lentisphaerota bacterium]
MAVRISDIAALAGVNASTVSRALRGDERIQESTRDAICRLASEMGYFPNLGARQLANGRTGVVAVTAGYLGYEYLTPAVREIDHAFSENGYVLSVIPDSRSDGKFVRTLRLFNQRFCDAAVLFSPAPQPDDLPELVQLQKKKFPMVCIDQWLANYSIPAVSNDAGESIRQLGEKFCQHQVNAAAVIYPDQNTVSLARRRAATDFLTERNIPYVTELADVPELLRRCPRANFGIFSNNPSLPELEQLFGEQKPARCIGCMFDSWKFNAPACFDAIYLCIQDIETTTRIAGQYLQRMLAGDFDIEPVTLIPPKTIFEPILR